MSVLAAHHARVDHLARTSDMNNASINDPKLRGVRSAIAMMLEQIQDIVGPDYRLTLIARHKSNDNAHIMLSEGDERNAISAAQKLLTDTKVNT